MATPPLSPRLLAVPWWGLLGARRAIAEFRAPMLELRVGGRSPLPPPEVLRALVHAPDVRGIWLKVDRLGGGQATLVAVAEALRAARAAGRLVVGEFDWMGNAELLVASACDRAYVRPGSQTWCVGLGGTLRFFGDLLDRHGVSFDVEAVGEFKAFGEQFSRGFASTPNREAMRALIDDLHAEWIAAIAEGRRRPVAEVEAAIRNGPSTGEELRDAGLVDGVAYGDEVAAEVEKLVGTEPRVVPFAAWYAQFRRHRAVGSWMLGHAAVPVLRLEGAIVDGQGQPGAPVVPGGVVIEQLRRWEEDDTIKAVVLRVNSPGGSAAASDLAWRAVSRLAAKKPVVASFGDVCASGGVYLTAACHELLCAPSSITGSIGVVAGKPVLRAAMERHGVHSEDILAAPHADVFSETAFSASARARVRVGLDAMYRQFVDRVASGRKRPYAEVEPLARGRVWSGRRAHGLGLVDHLGGIDVALGRAAALAGASSYRTWDVPVAPRGGWVLRALRSYSRVLLPELAVLDRVPLSARLLSDAPGEALALWPFDLDVR